VGGVLVGSGDGSVVGMVRSGSLEDGYGGALGRGTAAATLTSSACCSARWLLRWVVGPLCQAFAASMMGRGVPRAGAVDHLEGGMQRDACGQRLPRRLAWDEWQCQHLSRQGMASLPKPDDCGRGGGGRSGGCQWRSWGSAAGAWKVVVDASSWWSRQLVRAAGHGLVVVV
jgi:hypothetical protein